MPLLHCYFSITADVQYCNFQVYSIVIRHLYYLQNDPFDKSSIHLAPYIDSHYNIIASIPYALFIGTSSPFEEIKSSPFAPSPSTLLPSDKHQFVLCIYRLSLSLFCLFILFSSFHI